jgi:hypothetical protein
MYAILAAVPGVAILTDLWIILSTSFMPRGTICCFWGWMIGHMILILPDVALNIAFAYFILAPVDETSNPKSLKDLATFGILKAMAWLAPIVIMTAALELFAIIGYIMYHKNIRAEGNISQVVEMKTLSSGMTPTYPQTTTQPNQRFD